MISDQLALGALACNCVILGDEHSRQAIVIDGGDGVGEVTERLRKLDLRAKYLLHTHAHIDHIGDAGTLRARTGGAIYLHPADLPLYQTLPLQAQWLGLAKAPAVVALDGELADEELFQCGALAVKVLHTPGHTPGSVCFVVETNSEPLILSGDTLFAGSIGRWDLGGTSQEDIVESIKRKLLVFPDPTTVVPGHGPSTTIGIERRSNPFLVGS
ncbi:MAG: MBL fold metallo-hydrolase [Candidatus Eremiobacteraeota bacterium]|nr:MBL fold metallo-hydrolase [Candidatus Eremiobacteraeota bacterium]